MTRRKSKAESRPEPKKAREPIVEGSIVDRRYLVRRVIATGGMGVVLEVEHVHTRRKHALKALRADATPKERERTRLLEEAAILSATRHPNIVEVFDAGECQTFGPFVVLEALEGRSLETIVTTRGALPAHEAVSIIEQICAALEHVHARGYVHRDVKPGNVYVARGSLGREVVKLIDFGLAIPMADQDFARATERGRVVGTPEYMAPEQLVDADELDARCDVYSAAVIMYEMLTGSLPSESGSDEGDSTPRHDTPEPVSARRLDVGTRFDAVVASGLAHRSTRTRSAAAFAEAIEHAAEVRLKGTRLLSSFESRPDIPGPATQNVDPSELFDHGAVPPPLPAAMRARRRHTRVPFTTPVRVSWASGHADGRTEDISEGGMLVMLDDAPPEGTQVEVHFDLPGTSTRAVVHCRVGWMKPGRRLTAAGLEFLSVSDALRRVIVDLAALSEVGAHGASNAEGKEHDT